MSDIILAALVLEALFFGISIILFITAVILTRKTFTNLNRAILVLLFAGVTAGLLKTLKEIFPLPAISLAGEFLFVFEMLCFLLMSIHRFTLFEKILRFPRWLPTALNVLAVLVTLPYCIALVMEILSGELHSSLSVVTGFLFYISVALFDISQSLVSMRIILRIRASHLRQKLEATNIEASTRVYIPEIDSDISKATVVLFATGGQLTATLLSAIGFEIMPSSVLFQFYDLITVIGLFCAFIYFFYVVDVIRKKPDENKKKVKRVLAFGRMNEAGLGESGRNGVVSGTFSFAEVDAIDDDMKQDLEPEVTKNLQSELKLDATLSTIQESVRTLPLTPEAKPPPESPSVEKRAI